MNRSQRHDRLELRAPVALAAALLATALANAQGGLPPSQAAAPTVPNSETSAPRLGAAPVFEAPVFGGADPFEADDAGPIRLAQSSDFANAAADTSDTPAAIGGPPGAARDRGVLQGIDLVGDWSPRFDGGDGFGRSTLGATVKLGVPPPLVGGIPLLVAPRAAIHFVDGPSAIDVPSRLYDLEIGFRTFRKLSDRWNAMASVNVGVFSDDYSFDDSDALRPNGSVVAIYSASPTLQWVFGVAYLNRDDIPIIPAVGVIIDRGDVRYELSAPRPRIVWRRPSAAGEERSFYLAGELGGGAWAVRRDSGVTETLNLSRFGLLAGCETAVVGGWKRRYEFGYVFGQEIEYADSDETLDLGDSVIARVGWSY